MGRAACEPVSSVLQYLRAVCSAHRLLEISREKENPR